jgi:protein-disulfide isomerase
MHDNKELEENLRQYCMEAENQSQYFEYLSCFLQGGNSSSCLTEAGINLENLANCISETDATYNVSAETYPVFDVQKDLNDLYGVTGSPTIIINGQKVTVNPRTPENFKQVICSAFNTSPEECSQTLSTELP